MWYLYVEAAQFCTALCRAVNFKIICMRRSIEVALYIDVQLELARTHTFACDIHVESVADLEFCPWGAKYLWYISNSFKTFSILSTSAVVNMFEYNIGYMVQVLMRTYRKTGGCSGTWGLWRDPPLCGVSLHVCRLCIMKSCMWKCFCCCHLPFQNLVFLHELTKNNKGHANKYLIWLRDHLFNFQ